MCTHPLLLTGIQVSDPGPMDPLVSKLTFSKNFFGVNFFFFRSMEYQ